MKAITIQELQRLADYYNGSLIEDTHPLIDFGGYGFEATDHSANGYYGFRFFGHTSKQAELIDLWEELTSEQVKEKLLTVDLAKSLLGKTVTVAYRGNNGFEYPLTILIKRIEERHEKAIGQATTNYLIFDEDSVEKSYIYEWQGIFRCTGSAHKVYLKGSFLCLTKK